MKQKWALTRPTVSNLQSKNNFNVQILGEANENNTVEPRYNEDLGTMKITLL